MGTKTPGRCTVADPAICHGEPTFRATYASQVADALEQVESGMALEAIIEERRHESDRRCECQKPVRMAREALVTYAPKLVSEPVIA